MKLESAGLSIAGSIRMERMHPGAGGSVVAAGNGRGKTAVTMALAALQATVTCGRVDAAGRIAQDCWIELRAVGGVVRDVMTYRLRIAGGRHPRIEEETLCYGGSEPVKLIAVTAGRGTWRPDPDSRPEPLELATPDGCALHVAGALREHPAATRLKRWIDNWKIDRWTPGPTPLSEARTARPRMLPDGHGALAAAGWIQEKQPELFERLRANLCESSAGRLTDVEAIRSPDDQVTVWATLNGTPRVRWEQLPEGFREAIRLEVRLLTSGADDLIWCDCPDAAMDDDLRAATAQRICGVDPDGPQAVMLTRSQLAVERAGGPNRYVVTKNPDEVADTQAGDRKGSATPRFIWMHPMAG